MSGRSLNFFAADDNGTVKSCGYTAGAPVSVFSLPVQRGVPVQKLAVCADESGNSQLAVARKDGTVQVIRILSRESLHTEPIIGEFITCPSSSSTSTSSCVGLEFTSDADLISCSSTGRFAFRSQLDGFQKATSFKLGPRMLDMRINDLSSKFIAAGLETEVSLFDLQTTVEGAQSYTVAANQQKSKSAELRPGEIWRSKNVSNDNLSLHVPVHHTSLSFLPNLEGIVSGQKNGDIRLYDPRAARRPTGIWKSVCKNGVRRVEIGSGFAVWASDNETNLWCLDRRTGRQLYKFPAVAGSVTGIAPTPFGILASVSLDRTIRFHSTTDLPTDPKDTPARGKNLVSEFVKTSMTSVQWDGITYADALPEKDEAEFEEILRGKRGNVEDDEDDEEEDAEEKAERIRLDDIRMKQGKRKRTGRF